jgi:hypothetical protein
LLQADLALEYLSPLHDCDAKTSLQLMVKYVLDRIY